MQNIRDDVDDRSTFLDYEFSLRVLRQPFRGECLKGDILVVRITVAGSMHCCEAEGFIAQLLQRHHVQAVIGTLTSNEGVHFIGVAMRGIFTASERDVKMFFTRLMCSMDVTCEDGLMEICVHVLDCCGDADWRDVASVMQSSYSRVIE